MISKTTNSAADELQRLVHPGIIVLKIYKSAMIAEISGGDGGPGIPLPPGMSVYNAPTYAWSLHEDQFYTGPHQDTVVNTLSSCVTIIAAVAMQSVNSCAAKGSGGYTSIPAGFLPSPPPGRFIQISGTQPYGSDSSSFPATGQIQIRGEGIDISGANEPGIADISLLPVGQWIAQPLPGYTKRILGLIIEE